MAEILYTSIKKEVSKEVKKIKVVNKIGKEVDIEVKQFLPHAEKIAIVSIVTPLSLRDGISRLDIVEPLVSLELVYRYTNIKFNQKDKDNAMELYDELYSNGIVDLVKGAIPTKELDIIYESIETALDALQDSVTSSLSGSFGVAMTQEGQKELVKEMVESMISKAAQ